MNYKPQGRGCHDAQGVRRVTGVDDGGGGLYALNRGCNTYIGPGLIGGNN